MQTPLPPSCDYHKWTEPKTVTWQW